MGPEGNKICREAIEQYGERHQLVKLLEELAELQKEICKYWDGKGDIDRIVDETSDVEITLAQLKMIFHIEEKVDTHRAMKLLRLHHQVEEDHRGR